MEAVFDDIQDTIKDTLRHLYREELHSPVTSIMVERVYMAARDGVYIGPSDDYFIIPEPLVSLWNGYDENQQSEVMYFLTALDKRLATNTWQRSIRAYLTQIHAAQQIAYNIRYANDIDGYPTKYKELYHILQLAVGHHMLRWCWVKASANLIITWRTRFGKQYNGYTETMLRRDGVYNILAQVGYEHSSPFIRAFFKNRDPVDEIVIPKFLPSNPCGASDLEIIEELYAQSGKYAVKDMSFTRQQIYYASIYGAVTDTIDDFNDRILITMQYIEYQDLFLARVLESQPDSHVLTKAMAIYSQAVYTIEDLTRRLTTLIGILKSVHAI